MVRWWAGSRASLATAGGLLLLLAVLAPLQYWWIGEVSRAERARLRSSLETAAGRLAAELDAEIARVFWTFQPSPASSPSSVEEAYNQKHSVWTGSAPHPELVRELFLAERVGPGEVRLRRFDVQTQGFVSSDWPKDLAPLRERLSGSLRPGLGRARFGLFVDGVPAVVLPSERSRSPRGLTIVLLDASYIEEVLLPELVERYFGDGGGIDYDVAVFPRVQPENPVYRSDPAWSPADFPAADVTVELFRMRPPGDPRRSARFPRLPGGNVGGGRAARPARPSLRAPEGPFFERMGRAEWQLAVRHHAGSLEAVVGRARMRNLLLSLGILALLGASVVMLLASERRAHRLAKQQMEFVAGVTHELNTPLAGIRSAAQNLADGVVGESDAVRRYGAVIEKEGRRLSEMLEHVLEFSGIQSGLRVYRTERLDVGVAVQQAIDDNRWLIEERGVELETQLVSGLPLVSAERAALRRALGNLIGNAVKYGGGWMRVGTGTVGAAPGQSVEISIEDRGPGILGEDRRRIFEAFYRGHHATADQTPGSGLGLSVVKEIVESHNGSVRVETPSEGGSRFVIQLPAAAAERPESPSS